MVTNTMVRLEPILESQMAHDSAVICIHERGFHKWKLKSIGDNLCEAKEWSGRTKMTTALAPAVKRFIGIFHTSITFAVFY